MKDPIYYANIIDSGKVYVLDLAKNIIYTGNRNDVILTSNPQLHDDDSETYTLVVTVNGKTSPCYAARQFATEKEFLVWKG